MITFLIYLNLVMCIVVISLAISGRFLTGNRKKFDFVPWIVALFGWLVAALGRS